MQTLKKYFKKLRKSADQTCFADLPKSPIAPYTENVILEMRKIKMSTHKNVDLGVPKMESIIFWVKINGVKKLGDQFERKVLTFDNISRC